MKIDPVRGTKFLALVKKHAAPLPQVPVLPGAEPNDPLAILLSNYLLWESSAPLVSEALQRISRIVVDANELRVMLESEVIETIGEKYPFVEERARRLRATLNDIFKRQHKTSLDHLRGMSRKDQRAYLEGLAEIPPFVAARTLVVAFENPAPIVDDTATELLFQQGVLEPTTTTAEVVAWCVKHCRVEEYAKISGAMAALSASAWSGGQKGGLKVRGAYLDRHAGFRAAVEAEARRIEDEQRAKAEAAERAAEERRLAELAREEERIRLKREAEEARVRERQQRESERVAKAAAREAERVAREKAKAKAAEERAKREAAEAERKRKDAVRREAERMKLEAKRAVLAKKKAELRKKVEAKRAALARKKAELRKKVEAKRAALARKKAELRKKVEAKRAALAKKKAAKRKPAKPVARKAKPAARKAKPAARKAKPAASKAKPAARKAKPAASKAKPARRPARGVKGSRR